MASLGGQGSQSDANSRYYSRMNYDLLQNDDGQEFFASTDEVYVSFEPFGLQENFLKGLEKPADVQQRGVVATFFCRISQQLDYGLEQAKNITQALAEHIGNQFRGCFGGTHVRDDHLALVLDY